MAGRIHMIGWMIGGLLLLMAIILFVSWSVHIKIRIKNTVILTELSVRIVQLLILKKTHKVDWIYYLVQSWSAKKNTSQKPTAKVKSSSQTIDKRWLLYSVWHTACCQRFVWQLELGLDNAAQTAIAAGIMTGIQSFGRMILEKKRCMVRMICRPDFEQAVLQSELDCIITFRLGKLIKELASGFIKRKVEKIR